jgi:hypothetical protein
MRGFRAAILPTGSLGQAVGSAAMLTAMGAIYAAVGLARFRIDQTKVGWA